MKEKQKLTELSSWDLVYISYIRDRTSKTR